MEGDRIEEMTLVHSPGDEISHLALDIGGWLYTVGHFVTALTVVLANFIATPMELRKMMFWKNLLVLKIATVRDDIKVVAVNDSFIGSKYMIHHVAYETPKSLKAKRALEKRAPKLVEYGKKTLILHGTKTSDVLISILTEIYHLKKDNAVKYNQRNDDIIPFESVWFTLKEAVRQSCDRSNIGSPHLRPYGGWS